jgi:hypothetical protein
MTNIFFVMFPCAATPGRRLRSVQEVQRRRQSAASPRAVIA